MSGAKRDQVLILKSLSAKTWLKLVELRNKFRDGNSLKLIICVTIFLCFAVCDSRASHDALFWNSQEYSANENKQDFDCVVLGIPMGVSVSSAIILFFVLLQ